MMYRLSESEMKMFNEVIEWKYFDSQEGKFILKNDAPKEIIKKNEIITNILDYINSF